MSFRVAIAGASGYTGFELLRILQLYEEIEINQLVSRQFSGKTVKEVFPVLSKSKVENLLFEPELDLMASDFYFLALPHEASLDVVKNLIDNGKRVIDLSGAYRIKDISKYPEYYGFEHSYPEIVEKAIYGLPEIFRDRIRDADIVANPGCYPTCVILGLYPAVNEGILDEGTVIVNSLSGISGAGRTPKQQFHYPEGYSDVYPYNVTKHRHVPEMEDILGIFDRNIRIRFTPHIIPVSRGMLSTITFKTKLKKDELLDLYIGTYGNETYIRIIKNPPHIKDVIGSNYCDIYIDKDERTGYALVCSAIDNLSKGASTQAIQNFNIMVGIGEERYLKDISSVTTLFP